MEKWKGRSLSDFKLLEMKRSFFGFGIEPPLKVNFDLIKVQLSEGNWGAFSNEFNDHEKLI
jgi:hypothetical protein